MRLVTLTLEKKEQVKYKVKAYWASEEKMKKLGLSELLWL